MSTRTRTRTPHSDQDSEYYDTSEGLHDYESMSDDEIEGLLFEEPETKPQGFWNLPTAAGLSIILVGVAYLFQEMGLWNGPNLAGLAAMIPWVAGVLIILLGFGVLSWKPNRKSRKQRRRERRQARADKKSPLGGFTLGDGRRKLVRSRDKKIAGVCGGLAEYFNLDPTVVRIAFVIGTIISQGSLTLGYFILSYVMPKPEDAAADRKEERITIIRDY